VGLAEDVGNLFIANGQQLGVTDATLIKVAPGSRTPGSLAGGTNPTTTNYACKGFVSSFESGRIDGTIVKAQDRLISIFAVSLPPGIQPQPNDKITIEGLTYRVVADVSRDPASTMFTAHSRK